MSVGSNSAEEEDAISIKQACEEEMTREEDAIAVLGAADENNCTYPLGYMERQAVFSCVTCDIFKNSPAGVCYACAVHCHRNHDLVELYTKRNFRCDCGNSKFDGFKCSLQEEKETLNTENVYNHNFSGKYCTCDRPFPDPEDEIEDEMIQCVVCEDWYHSRHLGCLAPAEYAEMICDQCVKKHQFLQFYKDFEVPPVTVVTSGETNEEVDVTSKNSSPEVGNKEKQSTADNETCLLETFKKKHKQVSSDKLVVMFLEDGWRSKLCQCELCLSTYKSSNISFLVNVKDTIQCYEEKGKQNVEKVFEEAATTISNMNKVQHVELLQGYHELKSGMQEYFNKFPEGHVISTEEVHGFFENLNRQKRRRLDGLPPT